jgi:hypothetical protein
MAVPWLRIFDALLGVGNLALARRLERRSAEGGEERSIEARAPRGGSLEARMANVVVAALKEVFDRDAHRLELERQQAEAERERAERALRLELCRQAGERELGRLRVLTAVTVVAAVAALVVSVQSGGRPVAPRILLGVAWGTLLGALATTFAGQSAVGRAVDSFDPDRSLAFRPPLAGALASWLVIIGLALLAAAVLVA